MTKKIYQPIVELLQANPNKKVSSLLPEILELTKSKQAQSTIRRDEDGNVTHIFCYYHKEWEPVSEYAPKKHSTSGYNTMCKSGQSHWSRQQRQFRKAQAELLEQVASGTLAPDQVETELARLEEARKEIIRDA